LKSFANLAQTFLVAYFAALAAKCWQLGAMVSMCPTYNSLPQHVEEKLVTLFKAVMCCAIAMLDLLRILALPEGATLRWSRCKVCYRNQFEAYWEI